MYINKEHPNPWTELWDFQLVGSSFNGDTGVSRQATLRRAAKKQAEFESVIVGLERYEFDGNPAYRVFFDGREAGNVPADVALELAEMESAGYLVDGEDCDVYGLPSSLRKQRPKKSSRSSLPGLRFPHLGSRRRAMTGTSQSRRPSIHPMPSPGGRRLLRPMRRSTISLYIAAGGSGHVHCSCSAALPL